ncbi:MULTISPECIES: cold-shock protein [unclassified Streptomyces]|uniref:cold-shock protein n=1 Tax=unclassified Streptomyces TaxID=2593676 RepID=UPI00380E295D
MHGTVRSWDDESGWGVLVSPEVPGEVWAHFSAMHTTESGEFASLEAGEAVLFTWEEAEQDGYSYRASQVRRPGAQEADPQDGEGSGEGEGGGEYSSIHIELDPG